MKLTAKGDIGRAAEKRLRECRFITQQQAALLCLLNELPNFRKRVHGKAR
ncbi:hypothetical protein NKJ90_19145 [Mesorhizobium sp. M0051]